MEQARYWNMWAKRKPDLNNLKPAAAATANSYGDSWEEQAFAEDAAGILGGCVWPPRSYSCSFCRREFRSAQALGGHMNVHRRDRARLKQSSIPPSHQQDSVLAPQIHALNTCTSFDPTDNPVPPQISTILYNNPNPDKESDPVVRSHLVRVSSPPGTNKEEKKTSSTLSFFSPHQQNNKINRMDVPLSPPPSWSSFVSGKRNRPDLMDSTKNEEKETDKVVVAVEKVENCVTEDRLSMNLNLDVICRREEEVVSCKRRRIESSPLIFFPDHRCLIPQVDVLKLRPGSGEELDLELRLGDGPKVK